MPKAYFEPEISMLPLKSSKKQSASWNVALRPYPVVPDAVARRILILAQDGVPPWQILGEVPPPMTPEAAELPEVPSTNEIIVSARTSQA